MTQDPLQGDLDGWEANQIIQHNDTWNVGGTLLPNLIDLRVVPICSHENQNHTRSHEIHSFNLMQTVE